MGVDAEMLVRLVTPISDADLIDASYQLAEACGKRERFWLSSDADLAKGEIRRALNRVADDEDGRYRSFGLAVPDGHWLWLSLWGRYYGPGYERGDLWAYVAIAEWLERNFPNCAVYYGGDSGETLEAFHRAARERLIAHWAAKGGRPYYAHEGSDREGGWGLSRPHPLRPTCPLCQRKATQYGSGGMFASWTCDGCSRHWIWIGGERVKAFDASDDFDVFKAAKDMREEEGRIA
jgi:hypothetical protein